LAITVAGNLGTCGHRNWEFFANAKIWGCWEHAARNINIPVTVSGDLLFSADGAVQNFV